MKIKSRYAIPDNKAYFFKSDMPSLTSQKFKDRVALDRIVDMSTGELVIKDEQAFLDLYDERGTQHSFYDANSNLFDATACDFQTYSNMYANAKNEFQGLPSEIRRKYNDNVDVWLDAVSTMQKTPPPVIPDETTQKSQPAPAGEPSGEKSV